MLLDREAMAKAISVSTDTLDIMRRAGCPQITVPGTKKILFDPGEVVVWLKENRNAADDDESLAAAEARADVVFGKRSA